jgi:hypothetical protein
MILALKLLLTPLMITAATLSGRRWGPVISGWLIGFPLTSGPVSIILAMQNGIDFAAHAAVGILGGQLSVLSFCLAYSLAARKTGWPVSLLSAVGAYIVSTLICNAFTLSLLPTLALALVFTIIVILSIPQTPNSTSSMHAPQWDIPARMLIATTFVFLLTTFSALLGAQLSGLIAPFPVYGVVLATFAHHQQGSNGAHQLLRGVAFGSFAFTSFFVVVAGLINSLGLGWTYVLAVLVTLLVNGAVLFLTRRTLSHPQPVC